MAVKYPKISFYWGKPMRIECQITRMIIIKGIKLIKRIRKQYHFCERNIRDYSIFVMLFY